MKPENYYTGKKTVGDLYTPGIRLWSNGVPLKVDTYKSCSNLCNYCFARTLSAGMTEVNGIRSMYHHRFTSAASWRANTSQPLVLVPWRVPAQYRE